jgi:phosphoribosylaminoimidazolecarboxamide formyltransferase / IMP cyclohydrolase
VSSADIRRSYRTIMDDSFPRTMEVSFSDGPGSSRQTLVFEKASWVIDGVEKGLRYGENPGQEAAMYRLVNGNLYLGEVRCIQPGSYLASNVELLQSGKHPGKTNITDADNALNILRYFTDRPTTIIVKHNNPCGVARADTLLDSFVKANMADRVAAYGGCIACNRPVDRATAELIAEQYAEVVVAPEFEAGVMDLFARKRNLRVMKIANMARLREYVGERFLDVKSLMDGGMIVQWSFAPRTLRKEDFLPATAKHQGTEYRVAREPTAAEYEDLLFGWLIECGVTSNSVIYVKDGVTVGIGTGEQDRVGVAEIARDKAYRKLADRIAWERYQTPYNDLFDAAGARARGVPDGAREGIDAEVQKKRGGIPGSAMVSDAFFPFRDGVEVGLREGVSSVVQPGGADRDHEVIEAVNKAGAAMVFTGQRCFKH